MTDYDVIVVGAGPAGCAAAYDLSVSGWSVLLLDRSAFPRVKACAGALTMKALKALRYSIRPVIRYVCTNLIIGQGTTTTTIFRGRHPISVMTVRSELDDYCLKQTVHAGASSKLETTLLAVHEMDSCVNVDTPSGTITAQFLIGADGANSQVRVLSNEFSNAERGFALEACIPLPDGKRSEMEFDFGVVQRGYGWIFPKDDHVNVGLYTNERRLVRGRELLAEYIESKFGRQSQQQLVGHHIGLGGWRYRPQSARIFLVGDAAGLVDPLLGEGIYNAIRSGQAAALAIERELATGESALQVFTEALKPIQEDVAFCHESAVKFYNDLTRGYRALSFPTTRYSLMKGYAVGWTFSQIRRRFFTLPLYSVPRADSLDGWDFQPDVPAAVS